MRREASAVYLAFLLAELSLKDIKKKNEKKKHLSAYDPKNYKKHGKEVNGGGDLLEPAPPCTELKISNHTAICRQHQISRVQT